MINRIMIIPLTTPRRRAKSLLTGFTIKIAIVATKATAIILKIISISTYKLNKVFTVVNKSPIREITITSTMIIPANVASVPISSLPVCLRIWLIIAVKMPIAAILKIISTSIITPKSK